VARNHHGTNHVHESTIHAFGDAVRGVGIYRGLLVGNPVFFEEGRDSFESFPCVLASFVCAEVNEGGIGLVLDEGDPFLKDSKNS
jgi:hypothetical protein